MKNKIIVITLVILVVGITISALNNSTTRSVSDRNSSSENNKTLATVYKTSTCGCCGVFANYMKGKGYDVKIENVADMSETRNKFELPDELESCHVTEVGGYVAEGHIPEEAIAKLLEEQPDIKGIGMAGMPIGSPGMPGPKTEEFIIYEINYDGTVGEVFLKI